MPSMAGFVMRIFFKERFCRSKKIRETKMLSRRPPTPLPTDYERVRYFKQFLIQKNITYLINLMVLNVMGQYSSLHKMARFRSGTKNTIIEDVRITSNKVTFRHNRMMCCCLCEGMRRGTYSKCKTEG